MASGVSECWEEEGRGRDECPLSYAVAILLLFFSSTENPCFAMGYVSPNRAVARGCDEISALALREFVAPRQRSGGGCLGEIRAGVISRVSH